MTIKILCNSGTHREIVQAENIINKTLRQAGHSPAFRQGGEMANTIYSMWIGCYKRMWITFAVYNVDCCTVREIASRLFDYSSSDGVYLHFDIRIL